MKVLVAGTLLLLTGVSSASDKAKGKELIQKARELSDIHADGAPAFRLEGTFRIIPKKSRNEIEGRYTEIWVSKKKWRRELQTSSFRRVEVSIADKKWTSDSGGDRPEAALYGPLTLLSSEEIPEVHHVSERKLETINAVCVELKLDAWSKGIDCIDPGTGVFLLQEYLMSPPASLASVHHSCIYRNYESFGERLFPRSIHCKDDRFDVDWTIGKLVVETSPQDDLFSKPPNAAEMHTCGGRQSPPLALLTPDPLYPDHHNESATVVLWINIDEEGKPLNPKVARSAGKDFDKAALDAIRNWRFKPMTCDGVPYAAQVNVELDFRKF